MILRDSDLSPVLLCHLSCLFDANKAMVYEKYKIQNTKLQKMWKWDCKCREEGRRELGDKLLYYYNNIIIYI